MLPLPFSGVAVGVSAAAGYAKKEGRGKPICLLLDTWWMMLELLVCVSFVPACNVIWLCV